MVERNGRHRALDPDMGLPWNPVCRVAIRRGGRGGHRCRIDGRLDNAFCAIRPPGHHAPRNHTMGFCFVNNVAVAARHALDVRGLNRVAIVDFDVHHGNGTEDIFAATIGS